MTRDETPENKVRRGRLMQARQAAGFRNPSKAAERFNWPQSTVRAHENGTRPLSEENVQPYAEAYGVRLQWILAGTGPMKDPTATSQASAREGNAIPTNNRMRFAKHELPIYGRVLAGQMEVLVFDDIEIGRTPCPEFLAMTPDAYAVRISGDSMFPRYLPGELLYVHPHYPVIRDRFVVVRLTDGVGEHVTGFVKQFVRYERDEVVLRQLNPPEELRIPLARVKGIHPVVGTLQNGI